MVITRVVSSQSIRSSHSEPQRGLIERHDPGRPSAFRRNERPAAPSISASYGSLMVRRSFSLYELQPHQREQLIQADDRAAVEIPRRIHAAPAHEAPRAAPASSVLRSASAHVIGSTNQTPAAASSSVSRVTPLRLVQRIEPVGVGQSSPSGIVSSAGDGQSMGSPKMSSPKASLQLLPVKTQVSAQEDVSASTARALLRSASTNSRPRVSFDNDTKKPLPTSLATLFRTPEPEMSPKARHARPRTPRASEKIAQRVLDELNKV
mmetsp:Transcript_42718/g.76843  ORF Transcript_42718/g.76843 Transcript_42718/m.76843 type:complete len:264 (-) Transcript_42718:96-887(-)